MGLPHIIPLLPALILTPKAQFSIWLVQLLIGSYATNITVIHLIGGILSIEGEAFFERFMQGIICVDFEWKIFHCSMSFKNSCNLTTKSVDCG